MGLVLFCAKHAMSVQQDVYTKHRSCVGKLLDMGQVTWGPTLMYVGLLLIGNSELGGLSPAALKFGTLDIPHFKLPTPLAPGHNYCDFVARLDSNLATVRSITQTYQESIRKTRQSFSPVTNSYQAGDLVLWNPKEHVHSFRSSKLAPKLLGPYQVISQHKNDVLCTHPVAQTSHVFHSTRLTPFIGSVDTAKHLGLLDKEEYIVEQIMSHRGKPPRLKTLQFLVRWAGYDSTSDTWESWATI